MASKQIQVVITAVVDADVTQEDMDNAAWEAYIQVAESPHFDTFGSDYTVKEV